MRVTNVIKTPGDQMGRYSALVALLMSGYLVSHAASGKGLVAYYPFEGDARDHSANGFHAVNHGGAFTTGVNGRALNLDGRDDYVAVPIDINPDVMPQMTITLWARTERAIGTLFSHDDGGYDRTIDIDNRGGGLGWSAFAGSGAVLGYHPVETGQWVFIAVSWNQRDETVRLQVNGSVYEKRGKLGFGKRRSNIGINPTFGVPFSGAIDEVRIYDYLLNPSEIYALRLATPPPPRIPASVPPPAKALVAYYPFDGNLRDQSGNSNHGTPRGNVDFKLGKIGQSVHFDGRSWIEVDDSNSLDLSAQFTFSAWLYKEDAGIGGWSVVLSKGDTSALDNRSPYALAHTQDGKYALIRLTQNNTHQMIGSAAAVGFRSWHLVTVTWDGATVKFYVDGQLKDSRRWRGVLPNSSAKLLIGNDPPGHNEFFRGLIDDLRIYNYALSADAISELSSIIKAQTQDTVVTPAIKGDCDKDGSLTVYDVTCALQMAVGKRKAASFMDVSGDGRVSSLDARMILKNAEGTGQ